MRSRKEIENDSGFSVSSETRLKLVIEVLLDIRDLLMKEKSGQFHLDLNEPNKEPDYSVALKEEKK